MRVDFKSWYVFQVSGDEMAGSIVAASRVGSRRVLFEPEEQCAERQGGIWHVYSKHSCNGNMRGPTGAAVPGNLCLSVMWLVVMP